MNGFLLAEREVRVSGRSSRGDSYKLEVTLQPSGSGQISVKVTPPPGVMGGESPSSLAQKYLDAFERALRQ